MFFDVQKYNFSIKDDQLPVPLPELRRRHSFLPFEELTKGRLVGETKTVGNLLVGHLGGKQSIFDLANQELIDEVFGRFARFLLADFEEITLRNAEFLSIKRDVALSRKDVFAYQLEEMRLLLSLCVVFSGLSEAL